MPDRADDRPETVQIVKDERPDRPAWIIGSGVLRNLLQGLFLSNFNCRPGHELAEALAAVESRYPFIAPAFLLDLRHEFMRRSIQADMITGFPNHLGVILQAAVDQVLTSRG